MRPTMAQAQLKDGFIYGDNFNKEYVYMPAGEIGISNPMCVYENNGICRFFIWNNNARIRCI